MKSRIIAATFAAGLGLALIALPTASAKSLTIGMAAEATSADPHYQNMTQNDAFAAHIYDTLVFRAPDMALIPALATSWRALDKLTWEFKLRDDVKFSNGEPFTSRDVLFTLCRTLNNPTNLAASHTRVSRLLTDVQTPDAHTVILKTREPLPLMPNEMARGPAMIWNGIVAHGELYFDPENGCGVTDAWPTAVDFNMGKVNIGTGPYVLQSYIKGTGIALERNENYWGEKPYWQTVRLIPVPNAGPRLTGLLSGDFDVIENPAARDLNRLRTNPKFGFVATPSVRLIYLQLDMGRENSPFVTAHNGKNPLQDLRVRRAINMAIDRNAINQRIMDGMATPTMQYMPDGMFGALPKGPDIAYDPEGAKNLLIEAGYPDGFTLTLATPNDRYINDGQIAQAVAQYLSRIGIKTQVDAMTASIFFTKRARREFSVSLGGWLSSVGEASSFFHPWIATLDRANNIGTSNYGGFSHAGFDQIYLDAVVTMDNEKRRKLLEDATRIALDNVPYIPLHFESTIWAFREGLSYEGRRDQYTLATSVKPTR